jgi:uncharacterized membrane protein (DUF4010 family)
MATDDLDIFIRFGIALALGLLIGVERGWHTRQMPEGARVAGVRTFGLIGLLGGLCGLLAELFSELTLGFAFIALAAILIVARLRAVRATHDYGVTTVVSALLTFVLGAVAVLGHLEIAAAAAVAATTLLGAKPALHAWIEKIEYEELMAVFKLLLMSLVLLPVLPDRGYGPWEALNPYELWLMVIFVAGISFVGYVAIRLFGASRGLLLAGLAGGLVSSTAATIGLARLYRQSAAADSGGARVMAAAIALAAATMFPRMILVAYVIDAKLLVPLLPSLGLAALATYTTAIVLWRSGTAPADQALMKLQNPFEFTMALQFGVLLAAVLLLAHALQVWFGDTGIVVLSALSGLGDVDAITLSLSRMAGGVVDLRTAAIGITVAALANTLAKLGLAVFVGGRGLALPVTLALGSGFIAGGIGLLFAGVPVAAGG